jgi:hypothetical protein
MISETIAAAGQQRPNSPGHQPRPGGRLPGEAPRAPNPKPDGPPDQGPSGPRAPYPVDDPAIQDPNGPGSEPDYLPGAPGNPNTRY